MSKCGHTDQMPAIKAQNLVKFLCKECGMQVCREGGLGCEASK